MVFSVSRLKGALPSKAWRTMPSSRSPRVMSLDSARPFRTLRMRFSSRTPVCTRWTVTVLGIAAASLRCYLGTKISKYQRNSKRRLEGLRQQDPVFHFVDPALLDCRPRRPLAITATFIEAARAQVCIGYAKTDLASAIETRDVLCQGQQLCAKPMTTELRLDRDDTDVP